MSQLKFVRSKSTIRSNPLGRIQQKLKQVQKPGKLHVSVGRSRQSSQSNEDLPISNLKHKMELQVLQLHQINENAVPQLTTDVWQSPLSNNTRLFNHSRKFSNSSQYNGNLGNIYNKQNYYTQTTCCSPKLSESENIFKFDTLQFKSNKLNSGDQKSTTISDTNLNTKFNFNQFALKQSKIINQECNLEAEQIKVQISPNINTKIKQNQKSYPEQFQQKNEQFILDIQPTFTKKNQLNVINTKPIIEQNEDLEVMKCSTTVSQRQFPKSFSEILTERSIVLNIPKVYKDTEIQTSFSQNHQSETAKSQQLNFPCKSTTNASVQTKSKNKNLGLFQYQLSYLSPKINKNFFESDLISLDDYQSQVIYGAQQENKLKNQQLRDIDLNQQLRSQNFNQNSNTILTKDFDHIEDSQYFNLQAEPKEINIIDKKSNNKRSISKSGCSSTKCYKEHLNILINQQTCSQDQPIIVQDNKQRYKLRNSNNSNKKQQSLKQTKKK